jgi:L-malate glycosyltransferase
VFLLPSATESFGLAALEALSCGVPVVASRVGGLPEVIAHCESGFLEPVGDIAAMAAAAARLVDDDALHARMSAAARAVAVERFRREPLIEQYEAAYRRALGR